VAAVPQERDGKKAGRHSAEDDWVAAGFVLVFVASLGGGSAASAEKIEALESQHPEKVMPELGTSLTRSEQVRHSMFRGASLHLQNAEYLHAAEAFLNELLVEDTRPRDLTVAALGIGSERASGQILAKQAGIAAGIEEYCWLVGRGGISAKALRNDGAAFGCGDVLLEIEGERGALLSYERVGLNLLQRMSGIATATHELTERVKRRNPAMAVVGTRKTPWGLLDKRALHLGGGGTHRLGLGDAILVKNNHLALLAEREEDAAPIAVRRAWRLRAEAVFIEVEVRSKAGAAAAGEEFRRLRDEDGPVCPCWLLLDNMPPDAIREILKMLQTEQLLEHVLIEASGNIGEENIEEYAESGADAASSGALTHSSRALDLFQRL
jgi:nicotinate-nucleotide pyrophosphorylase (carboxylating)